MRLNFSLAAVCLCLCVLSVPREVAAAKPVPPPVKAPTKVYAADDVAKLRSLIGQLVSVEGTILKQGQSKTGTVRYLNFTDDYAKSVSLVFFTDKGEGDFTKERLTRYVGRKYRVTGQLTEYQGRLQIKVGTLDQLQLVP